METTDNILQKKRNIHFLGIAGAGMSAVALLLKEMGHSITGSDQGVYPPISTHLQQKKIAYNTTYDATNIPVDTDIFVIGKSKRLTKDNEEVIGAKDTNKPTFSFPEILHLLTKDTHNIVCVGSYGKSTCTSLLAHCLTEAKKDPSFFIGAIPKNLNTSARKGSGAYMVLEGDEYPSSNEDSRAKFLHYNPTDVLVTSMKHDHVDVFPTQEAYTEPFLELAAIMPKDGLAVVNGDDVQTKPFRNIVSHITYGTGTNNDWCPANIVHGEDTTTFDLIRKGECIAHIETTLFGTCMVENICGVGALLLERAYITPEAFTSAVASYEGIKRRLELLNRGNPIACYDGFGSSAEKVHGSIDAIKHRTKGKLIVVFEPFATSWSKKVYLPAYKDLFKGVDNTIIYTKPLSAPCSEVSQKDLEKMLGEDITYTSDKKQLMQHILEVAKPNDSVIFLSSGSFDGIMNDILHAL